MINIADLISANEAKKREYARKRDTAALIQRVVSCLRIEAVTGEDLWHLISLTWITKSGRQVSPDYWRKYKVPGLRHLFRKAGQKAVAGDLASSIAAMGLPEPVEEVATRETGIVNFYNARRNSALLWCNSNAATLRKLFRDTAKLGSSNQARFELAEKIGTLPGIPLPTSKKPVAASQLITPFIACLDPLCRFPIVNGRQDVNDLLQSMHLASHDLKAEVKGLVGLIDKFGIADAFMIDVCARELFKSGKELPPPSLKADGAPLKECDESERLAVQKSGTIEYRNRHNKMTNALIDLFAKLKPEQGLLSNCRFDVLLRNYDGGGRDLLIEVKPDPDRGSLRIAIGQPYDYRRFLNNGAATDLAVLTISKPEQSYMDLLLVDRGITTLWFEEESCQTLKGDGEAWQPLDALQNSHSKSATSN